MGGRDMKKIPYLAKDDKGIWTLYADGEPYLMLAGEIHNSSSSNLKYMKENVWPGIRGLHLNTLILPVAWETVEPEEGTFDFSLVKGILEQAREEKMRLVLLWFGLWKNGESTYVPEWVKLDPQRFQRACLPGGIPTDTITPLCEEAIKADSRAFAELMRFLKAEDERERTVLMVQVENEIGLLGAERDFSALAEQTFRSAVPEQLFEAGIFEKDDDCGKEPTWKNMDPSTAPEAFMAWHYAQAVETITAAGKAEYPLPMYVNAWLSQFPDRPGIYPSGGPIARNVPIWKLQAPSIDVFAPDIYLSDFDGVCREYTKGGLPLLIPEARRDAVTASNVFPAFGTYHTLGFSPFGIEDFRASEEEESDQAAAQKEVLDKLQIDELAFVYNGTGKYLASSYQWMESIRDLYFRYRGTKRLQSYQQKNEHEKGTILTLSGCELVLSYKKHPLSEPGCAGLVIEDSDHSFWIIGCNTGIRLAPKRGTGEHLTILSMEEGHFEDSVWKRGRILNGDERYLQMLGSKAEALRFSYCTCKGSQE